MTQAPAFPDEVQPFSVEGANVRGRLVRLGSTFSHIIEPHSYPDAVVRMMGQTCALTAALANALKYDGIFILQTQSEGPLSIMVADIVSGGGMRGYARYDAEAFQGGNQIDQNIPHLLGAGHLAFTVDQGKDTERYQGITALEGGSLAECAQAYFRQSEQIETAILLASDSVSADGTPKAAALMIQKMPKNNSRNGNDEIQPAPYLDLTDEKADEAWRTAVALMSSMTTDELLDSAIDSPGLLYRLYHEDGVRIYDPRPLPFHCRCSMEKVAETLASFVPADLQEMKTEDGLIVATCEFCRTDYSFDDESLEKIRSS